MGYVYKYIDKSDNIVKYVGIVWKRTRTLKERIDEHRRNDKWCIGKNWTIKYIEKNINTRTDAEYLEAHFVALYKTNRWFNKRKAGWGKSSFINIEDSEWVTYGVKTLHTKNNNIMFRPTLPLNTKKCLIPVSESEIQMYREMVQSYHKDLNTVLDLCKLYQKWYKELTEQIDFIRNEFYNKQLSISSREDLLEILSRIHDEVF